MSLITINDGDEAKASVLRDNFNYLDNKIAQTENSVKETISNINSITANFKTEVDNTISDINQTIVQKINNVIINLSSSSNIQLQADRIHKASIGVNATIKLPTLTKSNEYVNVMLEFTLASGKTLTLPNNVLYPNGLAPVFIADGVSVQRLLFDTTDGGANWNCYYCWVGK